MDERLAGKHQQHVLSKVMMLRACRLNHDQITSMLAYVLFSLIVMQISLATHFNRSSGRLLAGVEHS